MALPLLLALGHRLGPITNRRPFVCIYPVLVRGTGSLIFALSDRSAVFLRKILPMAMAWYLGRILASGMHPSRNFLDGDRALELSTGFAFGMPVGLQFGSEITRVGVGGSKIRRRWRKVWLHVSTICILPKIADRCPCEQTLRSRGAAA